MQYDSANSGDVSLGRDCRESLDIERIIFEIEWLERIHSLPDNRPLRLVDRYAANQKHDEKYAANPWFRLWQRYGI